MYHHCSMQCTITVLCNVPSLIMHWITINYSYRERSRVQRPHVIRVVTVWEFYLTLIIIKSAPHSLGFKPPPPLPNATIPFSPQKPHLSSQTAASHPKRRRNRRLQTSPGFTVSSLMPSLPTSVDLKKDLLDFWSIDVSKTHFLRGSFCY
jgi:hypothetical protein